MELYPATIDSLTRLVEEWIINDERELEATFDNASDTTTFLSVAQRLSAKGYEALPQEDKMNIIELLIEAKLADNNHRAAAIATGCKFWELKTDEEKLTRARLYRNWRDSGVFGNKTKTCF